MPALRLNADGTNTFLNPSSNSVTTTSANPDYIVVNHTASAVKVTVSSVGGAPVITDTQITTNAGTPIFVGDVLDTTTSEAGIAGTGADFRMTLADAGTGIGVGTRVQAPALTTNFPVGTRFFINVGGVAGTNEYMVTGFRTGNLAVVGVAFVGGHSVLPLEGDAAGGAGENQALVARTSTPGGGGTSVPLFTTTIDKRSHFISGVRPNAHTTVNDGIGRVANRAITISVEPLHTDITQSTSNTDIDNIVYLLHATSPITFSNTGVGNVSSASVTTTAANPDFILVNNTASSLNLNIEGEPCTINKRSYIRTGPVSNAHTDVNNERKRATVGATSIDAARAAHTGIIDPDSNVLYFLHAI